MQKTARPCSRRRNCRNARARLPRSLRSCAARSRSPIRKSKAPGNGWYSTFAYSDAISNFVNGADIARYAKAGVITPDHTIRTKNWPMIAPAPDGGKLADFRNGARDVANEFIDHYRAYFARNNVRVGEFEDHARSGAARDPGAGIRLVRAWPFEEGCARSPPILPDAAVDAITAAEAIGRFSPIGEEDMFDCEYWSLEQAKLGSAKELPLAGQIAVITGAAGAIGFATAKAFAAAGAEIALLDLDGKAAQDKAKVNRRHGNLAVAATSPTTPRCARPSTRSRRPSAASISWCRMPALPCRAASARSTTRRCEKASS